MFCDLFTDCSLANYELKIKQLNSGAFATYGYVHNITPDVFDELDSVLKALPEHKNAGEEYYLPSDEKLEALPCADFIRSKLYGSVPCQIGAYTGRAFKLNALEFHKCNEILFITTPAVLILGRIGDMQGLTYHTSWLEAFFVPANTCVELYSSTLHFAPLAVTSAGVRQAVVQQRFTNTPFNNEFRKPEPAESVDKLLLERNKWVIVHPEARDIFPQAFVGLTGKNLQLVSVTNKTC